MADPESTTSDSRLRIRCPCGAGLLVAARSIGQVKRCPKCNVEFTVSAPDLKAAIQELPPSISPLLSPFRSPLARGGSSLNSVVHGKATCSVCQCLILPDEERAICEVCGQPHHSDCWKENFGCSAYGCTQVNVLKVGPDIQIGPEFGARASYQNVSTPHNLAAISVAETFPWEFLLLVMSVVAFLLSMVSYGVPSFLAGSVITMFYYTRNGRVNWLPLITAGLLCGVGFLVGVLGSISLYS
jgi:hypothetical protein